MPDVPFSQAVADNVMAAIAGSGKSLRQVAAESGINRTTLRDRLHDHRHFNTGELAAVARALGVDPSSFVTG